MDTVYVSNLPLLQICLKEIERKQKNYIYVEKFAYSNYFSLLVLPF